jgi:hypothetical protein
MTVDLAAVRLWLEASCALRGIPVAVTDVGTVARVGVLLGGRRAAAASRSGGRSARELQLPAGDDSGVVNGSGA